MRCLLWLKWLQTAECTETNFWRVFSRPNLLHYPSAKKLSQRIYVTPNSFALGKGVLHTKRMNSLLLARNPSNSCIFGVRGELEKCRQKFGINYSTPQCYYSVSIYFFCYPLCHFTIDFDIGWRGDVIKIDKEMYANIALVFGGAMLIISHLLIPLFFDGDEVAQDLIQGGISLCVGLMLSYFFGGRILAFITGLFLNKK